MSAFHMKPTAGSQAFMSPVVTRILPLRNAARLTEAKESARHTDVKTTMRYSHIGLKDQAARSPVCRCPEIDGLLDSLIDISGRYFGRRDRRQLRYRQQSRGDCFNIWSVVGVSHALRVLDACFAIRRRRRRINAAAKHSGTSVAGSGTVTFTIAPAPLPGGWPKLARHTL